MTEDTSCILFASPTRASVVTKGKSGGVKDKASHSLVVVDDSLCLKALQNDLTVCIRDEHKCNRRTHGGTISDLNLEGRQRLLVLKVDGQSAFIQPGLDWELIDK